MRQAGKPDLRTSAVVLIATKQGDIHIHELDITLGGINTAVLAYENSSQCSSGAWAV